MSLLAKQMLFSGHKKKRKIKLIGAVAIQAN